MTRALVFAAFAYTALLSESAWGHLLRNARSIFAAPELGLFVVVYLGLCGRGSPIALTAGALAIGYLRDLLVGAPRGVEALTFALCALCARLLHGRVFLDRWGQLAVVCGAFAAFHAWLLMLLGPAGGSFRSVIPLCVSALCVGPLVLVLLRRLDQRVAPDQRSLHMDGDQVDGWR